MAPRSARKPAETEPETVAAPLPGTTVALVLAEGVGEPRLLVLVLLEPEPALTVLVVPAAALETVLVALASREL